MIYVPYTFICPDTLVSLVGHDFTMVHMDQGDAYPRFLAERWVYGQTFILVEHDIIVPDGAIEALMGCERPWCYHAYTDGDSPAPYFGLVKFGSLLQRAVPRVWQQMVEENPWPHQPSWQVCDAWLGNYNGTPAPHRHDPDVPNLRLAP